MDKCICRFTGRAKEKLTITNKPIPTSIKVWILKDKGFFYHWFWYTKGNSSQGISPVPQALERNKIAVIVLALLNTLSRGPPGTYSMTLDNLFTFIKILVFAIALVEL